MGSIPDEVTEQAFVFVHNMKSEVRRWYALVTRCRGRGSRQFLVASSLKCSRPPPTKQFEKRHNIGQIQIPVG